MGGKVEIKLVTKLTYFKWQGGQSGRDTKRCFSEANGGFERGQRPAWL